MESDSIRASGSNTLIDLWIEGKVRSVCVTRAAIETYLGPRGQLTMSEEERCEFVRSNLPLVVAAITARLRIEPDADAVIIDGGQFAGSTERRKTERRKTERRKIVRPVEKLPHGDRRRGERRKSDRRKPPTKP